MRNNTPLQWRCHHVDYLYDFVLYMFRVHQSMIFCWMVLGKVICVVGVAWLPKYFYILMSVFVSEPVMTHIPRFCFLSWILLCTYENDLVLSVLIGVVDWEWFMEISMARRGISFYPLMKIPPVSYYAAEETACFKVLHSTWICAWRILLLVLKKKYFAIMLRALGRTKYEASESMFNFMSLA